MDERKAFLTRLWNFFGACDRTSFLQKLRDRFHNISSDVPTVQQELSSSAEAPQYRIIDINGTDAWHSYVERLKDISLLEKALHHAESLSVKENMGQFAASVRSMQKNLAAIPSYVDKKFKTPDDIDEGTSGDLADKTGGFVKNYILDFLRICHNSAKHSQGAEQIFYEDFAARLEQYLSSICVYRKDIVPGMDLHTYADWFEAPTCRETHDPQRIGIIDEVDSSPHVIFFRDDYGECEEKKIKGSCIVFTAMRKK